MVRFSLGGGSPKCAACQKRRGKKKRSKHDPRWRSDGRDRGSLRPGKTADAAELLGSLLMLFAERFQKRMASNCGGTSSA